MRGGNLWIDSSDFKTTKIAGEGKKSAYFSYKSKSFGRRFMVLRDGKGRVMKLWGGYSPKIYDSHFVEAYCDWFEENLLGGFVYGDGHFVAAAKMLKKSGVKFITPRDEKQYGRLAG